jgi:hypothetical protein
VIPNIFKHEDKLVNLESQELFFAGLEVIEQCWKLDAELQRWYKDLESSTPGPLYWAQFSKQESPTDDLELGKLFPVAFHFPSLFTASMLTMYWTATVLAWSMLTRAYNKIPAVLQHETLSSTPPSSSISWRANLICSCKEVRRKVCLKHFDATQLPPLEHRADWAHSVARDLFQSVEYCMQEEMLAIEPQVVAALVAIVLDLVVTEPGDWSREILWAKANSAIVHVRGHRLIKYIA